ncbi:adenylate cyclase type 9 isoform X2 [Culicoides brevitarsis]
MPPGVMDGSRCSSVEDIQISLAPHIQEYLTKHGRRHSCCSVTLPVAFERAAPKAWIDPHFDSAVLEGQYLASVFPQIRLRFRFALTYILLSSLAWLLYFLAGGGPANQWYQLTVALSLVCIFCIGTIWITDTSLYRAHAIWVASITAFLLCVASLCFMKFSDQALSPLGHFGICIEIIFLIYTVFPFPFWACILTSVLYSVTFEVLAYWTQSDYYYDNFYDKSTTFTQKIMIIRILLQICVHLVAMHILVMSVIRMRGTFMKVGQNLLVRRQLEMEKQLKEKMIHSMMPPRVAELLMREGGASFDQEVRPRHSNPSDLKSLFRPFHMNKMNNVSILFADIVGFTKMSSTKTAEQLVEILNDLFERFDYLCLINGCEKISTLGDCYYCVSGCPEPRDDHAMCCVEMGLGMISAIKIFDAQRGEGVNMRVGIHTGSVLCGIVGTKRVKFDVWSNDVSLANKMESSGRPGQVHVSEETRSFLGDSFVLEEGEEVFGHRTFFVLGRVNDHSSRLPSQVNLKVPDNGMHLMHPDDTFSNRSTHLSQSVTNLSSPSQTQFHVPPASPVVPQGQSPVLSLRPRLKSIGRISGCFAPEATSPEPPHHASVERQDSSKSNKNVPVTQALPKIMLNAKSFDTNDDDGDNDSLNGDIENGHFKGGRESRSNSTSCIRPSAASRLLNFKLPKLMRMNQQNSSNNGISNTNLTSLDIIKSNCDKSEEVPCIEKNSSSVNLANNHHHPNNATYQQLPVISLAPRQSCHALDVPNGNNRLCRSASKSHHTNHISADNNSSISQNSNSLFDDIIDIRSYISQSRSDISPFGRTGSYRSQSGRHALHSTTGGGGITGTQLEVPQLGRPRSSTIASNCLEVSGSVDRSSICSNPFGDDSVFLPSAAASRKDSGIRSNSRRSSVQQSMFPMNTTTDKHRVSGYFTSSQSSLCPHADRIPEDTHLPYEMSESHATHPDPLGACLQQLRKQSDLQLIRCVRDNAKSQNSYLVKPPLSRFTLFFKSKQLETEFRSKAHRLSCDQGIDSPPTLATPKYNTYLDILVSFLVYIFISISLFLLHPGTYMGSYRIWVSIFIIFSCLHLFALFLCSKQMCQKRSEKLQQQRSVFNCISNWYPWHMCGALILSMPVISILVNFAIMNIENFRMFEFHFGFLLFVTILHFCNFTQLNCWWRNFLAFITSVTFVGIAVGHMFNIKHQNTQRHILAMNNQSAANFTDVVMGALSNAFDIANHTFFMSDAANETSTNASDVIQARGSRSINPADVDWFDSYRIEIYLDLFLLLVLVWFLNREFEIGYRLSFYGSAIANQDKMRVQNMKNQADMLLHNIIPKHVAEELKCTAKYSKNYHEAGIVFASIVNFNEMYDESYLGGKEYLRVLNELIGDFDELLGRPEFKAVEKIKTIGSSFMCASGLNPSSRGENNEHLIALMDFAIAMQAVIDNFNRDLLEFNLILRIGYNIGDVTAGVIGTSKLYYDIWGDAVNIASRMDSTGVAGRIQVSSHCLPYLESTYEFESRGQVYVKGKDNMEVFLLKCKRPVNDDLPSAEDDQNIF